MNDNKDFDDIFANSGAWKRRSMFLTSYSVPSRTKTNTVEYRTTEVTLIGRFHHDLMNCTVRSVT